MHMKTFVPTYEIENGYEAFMRFGKQTEDTGIRRAIIETTYKNALAAGDKNVYFLDGLKLTELCKNDGSVDRCHPNDFGFMSMAKALIEVMENIKIPTNNKE